jgi:hypothetical protein
MKLFRLNDERRLRGVRPSSMPEREDDEVCLGTSGLTESRSEEGREESCPDSIELRLPASPDKPNSLRPRVGGVRGGVREDNESELRLLLNPLRPEDFARKVRDISAACSSRTRSGWVPVAPVLGGRENGWRIGKISWFGVADRRCEGDKRASMAGWGCVEPTRSRHSEKAGLKRIGASSSGVAASTVSPAPI